MKSVFVIFIGALLFCTHAGAQERIVDATDRSPISAASIFDAAGNMIGLTWNDGKLPELPAAAYPVTIRCLGYEQLVMEKPEKDRTWEMIPMVYELEEVVIVPVKRNILRQSFYVREYFSMHNDRDTITFFIEHMADRFVPVSKGAKFGGSEDLRILDSRSYSRYKIFGKDSLVANSKNAIPSLLNVFDQKNEVVKASEALKQQSGAIKFYEESGKSGLSLIQKQNDKAFIIVEDALARTKEHKRSPAFLKLLGFTMEFNQLYTTHAYSLNDEGVYAPKDLMEASLVMQADGRGKLLRMAMGSDKPIIIRSMIELYVVDLDFLTSEEAKQAYRNKPSDVKFVVPSAVPPLNDATRRLVERAVAESESRIK